MSRGKRKMPKAYSYLRFSTPEQAKGDSKRRQWQLAKDYAEQNGLELDEELTYQFHDLGVSAFRGDNKETGRLGDFLAAVKKGLVARGSYLLVESLDRLSRNFARKAARVLEDICEEDITVVTLSDGRIYTEETLDTDPTAFIMAVLIFFRANEESEMKSKRLKAAWENKRDSINSKPLTAKIPAWLELDKKTHTIKIIKDRAAIVRRIYALYLEGTGPKLIAKTLNEEKLETWGTGKRRGKFWYDSYIVKILTNAAVIGHMTPHKMEYVGRKKRRVPQELVKGYFPAVVDTEMFARVQELRKSNSGMKGMKASVPLRNIFSRLAKCPLCGAILVRVDKGGGCVYLACGKGRAKAGCTFKSVRYDEVESVFMPAFGEGLLKLPRRDDRFDEVNNQLNKLRRAISNYDNELDNLVSAVKKGKMSPRLQEEIERIEQAKEQSKKELQKTISEHSSLKPRAIQYKIKEFIATVERPQKEGVNLERVNALLRSLCKTIVIDDKKIVVEFAHGPVMKIDRTYELKYNFSAGRVA
jgi:DNA invertase Pin-like site-specific DNA recombinase